MKAADEQFGWRSAPPLLVLHAVRLAGFADLAAIAERSGIATRHVPLVLEVLEGQSLVEPFAFGGDRGWILTDGGRIRDDTWVTSEVYAAGAGAVLTTTAAGFETLNARLVTVISRWQVQTVGVGGPDDEGAGPDADGRWVIDELAQIEPSLADMLAELTERLPRFGRYPTQFRAALRKAQNGELRWIAGVGILSCHTVWAELHQDLLTALGRDRSAAGPPDGSRPAGGE